MQNHDKNLACSRSLWNRSVFTVGAALSVLLLGCTKANRTAVSERNAKSTPMPIFSITGPEPGLDAADSQPMTTAHSGARETTTRLEWVSLSPYSTSVVSSSDGRMLGISVDLIPWVGFPSNGFLVVSLDTDSETLLLDGPASGAQFSPDGTEIAVPFPIRFDSEDDAAIVNLKTLNVEPISDNLSEEEKKSGYDLEMYWGPDRVRFLTKDLMLWTGSDGFVLFDRVKKEASLQGLFPVGFPSTVATSGDYLAIRTSDPDEPGYPRSETAYLYRLSRQRLAATWPAQGEMIFSPNGEVLVELSEEVRIVDTATGKSIQLPSQSEPIVDGRLDDRYLYLRRDGEELWDVRKKERVVQTDEAGTLRSAPFLCRRARRLLRDDESSSSATV